MSNPLEILDQNLDYFLRIMSEGNGCKQFPSTPAVGNCLSSIMNSVSALRQEICQAMRLVEAEQNKCEHAFTPIQEYDENYICYICGGERGHMILSGKVCSICRLVQMRPKGFPWEICHMCWTRMSHDGIIPGQGVRIHVYVCPNCNHRVETT